MVFKDQSLLLTCSLLLEEILWPLVFNQEVRRYLFSGSLVSFQEHINCDSTESGFVAHSLKQKVEKQ